MKRIRKHIRQLHKIKIHHNRWLIWTVVIVIVIFLALISQIKISNYLLDQNLSYPAVLSSYGTTYKDSYLGFSVRHPNNWGIESSERTIVEFNDPQNNGQGFEVAVYTPSDEAILRKTLTTSSESSITVDGVTAKVLTLTKTEKQPAGKVVFVVNNGKLYMISGDTPFFDSILKTFSFKTAN